MCSLEHDQTLQREQQLRIGSKRHHRCIKVPKGVDLDLWMEAYDQGWGHSLACAIHFLRHEINLFEADKELEHRFIEFINYQRLHPYVHFRERNKSK